MIEAIKMGDLVFYIVSYHATMDSIMKISGPLPCSTAYLPLLPSHLLRLAPLSCREYEFAKLHHHLTECRHVST